MESSPASPAFRALLAGIALAAPIWATGAQVQAPSYTAAGIVSAASFSPDALAPNGITSIFGTNLSFVTGSITGRDLVDGGIPTTLAGVTVYVSGIAAGLYYVSPTQINFLVPNAFKPVDVNIVVVRDGIAGPSVTISLHDTGPALFQDAAGSAIAGHLDGSQVTAAAPAHSGEWVVLYAGGLGRTIPQAWNYLPATQIAPLADMTSFSVSLDGTPVASTAINYAGLAPGFAGLYQVNVKLPDPVSPNPEIRLSAGSSTSIPNIHLFVQ